MIQTTLISTCSIGDSIALLSPVSGAIVLTNRFGQLIHQHLMRGLTVAQIAEQIADIPEERDEAESAVRGVLETWEQAGLLQQSSGGFPDPVAFRQSSAAEMTVGGQGGTARIAISDDILAEQIETILGHFRPLPDRPLTRLSAQTDGPGFAVFKDKQPLSGRISLDAARFVLVRELAEIVCGSSEVAAVFHAGCVAQNGQALLICGDSGQGKSTLTFGLVAAGGEYLGDDHIPLHHDGRSALSFPTAAGVKPGSWGLPEIRELQTRHGLTPLNPREGVRYIPLHRASAPQVGEKRRINAGR
jgi:hypothetical protein